MQKLRRTIRLLGLSNQVSQALKRYEKARRLDWDFVIVIGVSRKWAASIAAGQDELERRIGFARNFGSERIPSITVYECPSMVPEKTCREIVRYLKNNVATFSKAIKTKPIAARFDMLINNLI